jgi:hypothetical protein
MSDTASAGGVRRRGACAEPVAHAGAVGWATIARPRCQPSSNGSQGFATTGCAMSASPLANPRSAALFASPRQPLVVPSPHKGARVRHSAPTATRHGQHAPPTCRLAGLLWTQASLCPNIPANQGVDERSMRGVCPDSRAGTKLVLCHRCYVLCLPLARPCSRVLRGRRVLCHRSGTP